DLRVELVFIDYGNRARRNFKDLFYLSDDLKEYPCQALECKILNVKPSLLQNPTGVWTKKSTHTFDKLISDEKYDFFEIFVHGLDENLAYINLFATTKNGTRDDFTNLLVKNGCADQMNKTEIDLNLSKQYNKQHHNDLFYITSRDSDYMPSRPCYTNQETELRRNNQTKQSKFRNKYYDGGVGVNETNGPDDLRMSLLSINSDSPKGDVDYDENDESSYDGYIELRGPYSPLECSYHSILNVGQSKKVRVERDSINYVTLDDDPTNESTRLMIAQEVTLNQQGNTMILRKTCLMPKLPGLPTICTLLFAPTVEFRTDRRETIYTGALCGLGYDDSSKVPIYTDNDIEMAFDIKIDANDITMINSVRMAINMVIGNEKEVQTWTNEEKNLRLLQQRACEKLLRLILRNREIIEPQYFSRPYKWNQVDKSHLVDPLQMENSSLIVNDGYYTHHKAVLLNEPDN
ncbi:unnamed protein product, partial [Brachionus calyciflorus]